MRTSLTPEALKGLRALDRAVQVRVTKKIQYYSATEYPLAFARSLTAVPGYYRFRVGDIRIIFRVEESAILITRIGKRDTVYE
jgi:mRNA-degrading endonuclease RelE of RelBE toxin-antitoxin system